MNSHKRLLTTALMVVTLLAMLAPAAVAAPEKMGGITIDAPTNAAPAYIENESEGVDIDVSFTIDTEGFQLCDVWVTVSLYDQGFPEAHRGFEIDYQDLNDPDDATVHEFSFDATLEDIHLDDGWYDLVMKAEERNDPGHMDQKCQEDDTQQELHAVLLDQVEPIAELLSPVADDYDGATFVTGTAFPLSGEASDLFGVEKGNFQLCPEGRECLRDWENDDWVKIADGVETTANFTGSEEQQFDATWDSTSVVDGWYVIRFCAYDFAGNSNCEDRDADKLIAAPLIDAGGGRHNRTDAHWIFVQNTYEIELQVGWNLVSTPLLPYNTNIDSVLQDLVDNGTVKSVWNMVWEPGKVWKSWHPGTATVDTLTTFEAGKGYWIEMASDDELDITGTWLTYGGNVTPPEYSVNAGWNLIGYTHWGRPLIWPTKTRADYLGPAIDPDEQTNVMALYSFDPLTHTFHAVYHDQHMSLGAGYWLGVIQAGNYVP